MNASPLRYTNQWILLGMLMVVSIISFIDRQLLSVLVDPIRADLEISDFEIGLLSGPAFVCFYIVGNLCAGRLADMYDRIRLIASAMCGWSLATASCALATNMPALFACRGAVGLFEGSIGPALHSVVADTFNRKTLPLALSIYSMSGSIGPGLAIVFGGLVAEFATTHAGALPLSEHFEPWQLTFIIVGLPGVLLAPALVMLVRLAPRPKSTSVASATASNDLKDFWRQRRKLILLFTIGIGFLCASELSLLMWLPTVLMRMHGLSPAGVAAALGPMLIICGAAGSLIWGLIATFIGRRGNDNAAIRTMTFAMAIMTPFLIIAPLMPSAFGVLLAVAPVLICKRAYVGLGHASVQLITPSGLRGRVAAIYLACTSTIGALLGPPMIGALSSFFFKDDASVDVALATVGGSTAAIGVACLLFCMRAYDRALKLAAQPVTDRSTAMPPTISPTTAGQGASAA